jgi:hypothetical protein
MGQLKVHEGCLSTSHSTQNTKNEGTRRISMRAFADNKDSKPMNISVRWLYIYGIRLIDELS